MAVGIQIIFIRFVFLQESELLEALWFPDCGIDNKVDVTNSMDGESEGPDGWGLLSLHAFGETIDDVTVGVLNKYTSNKYIKELLFYFETLNTYLGIPNIF